MVDAFPDDASIARTAAAVLDRTLPKAEWSHAAHFALALWLFRHQPGFDGARDMPAIIRGYNDATGTVNSDTSGYHHTITLASLAAAKAALDDPALTDAPLTDALAVLLAGPAGRSDWLLAHWSRDRLFSVAARHGWVPPDLAPLPF